MHSSSASNNLSTADVDVTVPKSTAESIITQVDRNALPTREPIRSTSLELGAQRRGVTRKPVRRTFLQRFFCCCSASDNVRAQSSATTTEISIGTTGSTGAEFVNERPPGAGQPGKMPDLGEAGKNRGKKLLALDLDETLVHSSFQPVDKASFSIAVTIEGIVHTVYVIKRPGCDEFLTRLAEHYELVIYTASLSKYADPLLDILDPHKTIGARLFRENCVFYDGHYVKDLSLLSREISQIIIVDNSPMSYIFHPENAIDCSSFFDDLSDVELWQIADFLVSIKSCPDVRLMCR